jgi:hypothetical protein
MTTTAADLKEQLKDLPHMQAMADNNLTEADLPGPIKMKMGPLKMQLVRFEKNQNPTKAQLDGLIALSVKVADAIQTWAEERSGAKPAAAASQTPPEPPTNPDDGKNAPPNLPGVVGAPASYPLREAFIWLSRGKDGVPAEIRTALAAYLDAVTQFHAERKEGKA